MLQKILHTHEYAYIQSLRLLILFPYLKIMKNHNRAKMFLCRRFNWMFHTREAIFPGLQVILRDHINDNCRHPLFSITFYHHCGSFATVILRVHSTSKQPSPWLNSTFLQRSLHRRPATYRKRNREMDWPSPTAIHGENSLTFSLSSSDHFKIFAWWHYFI